MKKRFGICAITLVIAGLMIAVSASAMVQIPEEENNICEVEKLDLECSSMKVPTQIVELQPKQSGSYNLLTAAQVWGDSTYNTVASEFETIVCGFEVPNAPDFPGVVFTASTDAGVTFPGEGAGWQYEYPTYYPDVDTCHDGKFIGTMVPDYEDHEGGLVWKMECSNPSDFVSGYSLASWDLSIVGQNDQYHFTDIPSESVGGYAEEDPLYVDFAYGGTSAICDYVCDDPPAQVDGMPVMVYSSSDTQGWIHWYSSVSGGDFTRMDIDDVTKISYTIANVVEDGSLFYYKFDYDTWNAQDQHPSAGNGYIDTGDVRDVNFDVSAYDNNVIVVSVKTDGEVMAYYSANGLSSVNEVSIASGACDPKVVHIEEDVAKCSYVKEDGSLYFRQTDDGGVTWTTEEKVDEPENADIPLEYGVSDVCGIGGSWWSSGESDITYFAAFGAIPEEPVLEIIGITGGIGVTATIKNTGNAPATGVELGLTVTGGILGLINKDVSDTVASLAVDEETTIRSGIIFGLGAVDIVVTVSCAEGSSDEETVDGTQLIIFTRVN